jgi:hypothetical protein
MVCDFIGTILAFLDGYVYFITLIGAFSTLGGEEENLEGRCCTAFYCSCRENFRNFNYNWIDPSLLLHEHLLIYV